MTSSRSNPVDLLVRRASAAVLALVLLPALPAGATSDVPAPVPGHGSVGTSIAWKSCGERLQCARIRVPMDWDRPRGRTISLKLVRHAASRPEQRIGTMFINPGGPGQSGVGFVKGGGDGLDAWGDGRFDVVSWDPRGTNASAPVRCFRSEAAAAKFWDGVSIPTTRSQSRSFRGTAAALARRCGKVSGRLLAHISTADTARDLEYLRTLVGDRRLTYVGLSYGTLLGQTYANMYPRKVRAMLLDGLVDPVRYSRSAEARVAASVAGTDRVFEKFLALCGDAGPDRCALAGHVRTPEQRVHRLFQRVRRSPVPAPGVSPPGPLDEGDLMLSQFEPLRDPSVWAQNAASLREALRGDASELEAGARKFLTPPGWAGVTTSAAVSCADAPAAKGLAKWRSVLGRLKRESLLQGRVQGWWLWAPCAAWPTRGQDAYRGPWSASTENPILLIGTRYDPNTAYRNAVRAQRLLGNAVLLTHEGYGHLSFQDPSACVERARVAYLVDLTTPPPGTVCMPDQVPFGPGTGSAPGH